MEASALASGREALEAVERRLGAPLRVHRVTLDRHSVDVEVQDPDQPLHVDRHRFCGGRLEDPEPVAVGRKRRQVEARLFELAARDLDRLPALLDQALRLVAADQGRVSLVTVERDERDDDGRSSFGRPRFRVHVEGPRAGGYVEFRLDGRRGRVVRW